MCQTSTSVNAANTLTNTTAGIAAAPPSNTSAPIQPTKHQFQQHHQEEKDQDRHVQQVTALQELHHL